MSTTFFRFFSLDVERFFVSTLPMRAATLVLTSVLAVCSLSQFARADEPPSGPNCKCDVGASTSGRGPAAACAVFGVAALVIARKRAKKN